jgi:hypothetical protein
LKQRSPSRFLPLAAAAALIGGLHGCVVREVCLHDADCEDDRLCDAATGACAWECEADADCGGFFVCEEHRCVLDCGDGDRACPDGMVPVCGAFCIDAWEASRPDATADDAGTDGSISASRAGVLPWFSDDPAAVNQDVGRAACEAAAKRLCSVHEWRLVCQGTGLSTYGYGDAYEPATCNGIDTWCECGSYPHCYDDCGAPFHVMPTGSFPGCGSGFGAWDLNGNVWEIVASDDGLDHYRGGAYNCADSELLHRCDYDATWDPAAKGFRCCADGSAP